MMCKGQCQLNTHKHFKALSESINEIKDNPYYSHPIVTHNDEFYIEIMFHGFSVTLHKNGRYLFNDTSGG